MVPINVNGFDFFYYGGGRVRTSDLTYIMHCL